MKEPIQVLLYPPGTTAIGSIEVENRELAKLVLSIISGDKPGWELRIESTITKGPSR